MSKKSFVGFEEMTAEELYDYNILEYKSQNIISKWLFNQFFKKIKFIIKQSVNSGDRLLEVGCGSAESTNRIFSMIENCTFEASEYDERYVTVINKKNFPFRVTQESVYDLKRDNNEFDLIFLLEVLEHLEEPEIAIKELFRVSNKYVVISVPNEPVWRIMNMIRGTYLKEFGNTPGHINHYNAYKLKNLLKPYSDRVKVFNSFPWIIAVAKVK
jgi:ubiquinone/menaquinone biosynthesis C-methylase UbiE